MDADIVSAPIHSKTLSFLLLRHFIHLGSKLLFAVRALEEFAAVARPFGGEPVVVADRAVLVHRLVVRKEIAVGVARATPEFPFAFAAATLLNVANQAFRAFYAGRHLARELACWIIAASDKFSEAACADEQLAFVAFRANFAGFFGRGAAFVFERSFFAAVSAV